MKVIPFEEKYRQDFIDFNTEWIISNFGFLEEHDTETFKKIKACFTYLRKVRF